MEQEGTDCKRSGNIIRTVINEKDIVNPGRGVGDEVKIF